MPVLCLIGVARSGTSRTISLLTGFERLNCRGEIFHPAAAFTLAPDFNDLARDFALGPLSDIHDKRLVSFVRSHPVETIEWLSARGRDRTLIFKLFPRHLSRDDAIAMLSHDDMRFIVTCRRPLDCYISKTKAKMTGHWRDVDTSATRIHGDSARFAVHLQRTMDWYDFFMPVIENRPHVLLSYDKEILLPDAEATTLLRNKLDQLGINPGPFTPPAHMLRKQDRTMTYTSRMSNWEAFAAEIKRKGLYLSAVTEFQPGSWSRARA